ncbi:MAG: hypothetical protein OEN20_02730 [Gammaproteobacteria bacterium]|nr:hypothetical protein [Gammaproteobacteria bacterium]
MLQKLRTQWEKFKADYQKRHPRAFGEEHLSDDVYLVIQASSDLDIAEFELFVNAYEKWFGTEAQEERVERYYLGYMFCGRVPHWVREYCRQVSASAQRHQLDPVRFGVKPIITRRVKMGLALITLAFGLVAALIAVAEYTFDRHYPHLRGLNNPNITYRP